MNEERKDNIEMIEILKGLEKEFEHELSILEEHAIHYDSMYTRSLRILYPNKKDKIPLPFIKAGIASILWAGTYDTGNGILESMIASGKIELIKNKELSVNLAQWDRIIKETQDNEIGMREYVFLVLIPKLGELEFNSQQVVQFHNIEFWDANIEEDQSNLRNILMNPEFKSLAQYRLGWLSGSKGEFSRTAQLCSEMLDLIRFELDKY